MKEYLTPVGPTPLHVSPIFEIGPVETRFSEWLVFEGISVDESGKQHFLDASVAYKRAVLNAIEYLFKFGYSKEQVGSRVTNYYLEVSCMLSSILTSGIGDFIQVYLLLSCCPCEGRISGIVDSPNAVTTLAIPTAIFDQVCCQESSPTQVSLVFVTVICTVFVGPFKCKVFINRLLVKRFFLRSTPGDPTSPPEFSFHRYR